MLKPRPPTDNDCADLALAANQLINRLQDDAGQALKPDAGPLPFARLIGELETAPEVRRIRKAAGDDPDRFGSSR